VHKVLVTKGWRYAAILLLASVSLSAQQPASPAPPVAVTPQTPTFKLAVNDVAWTWWLLTKRGAPSAG
jgi:hypothetical protein